MQKPLLALALVSAALCAEARAQTQYTVFVHGLGQTGDNWNALAGDLAARHPLSPLQPTLGSGSLFEAQAGVLRNYLDGWNVNGIAAISHSNGGLVVREYVRTTVAPRINRHLSLGTPHQGAALADHIRNGDVSGWAGSIIGYILDPIVYYASNDPDWWDLFFDHGSSSYFYDASYAVSDLLDSPSFPPAVARLPVPHDVPETAGCAGLAGDPARDVPLLVVHQHVEQLGNPGQRGAEAAVGPRQYLLAVSSGAPAVAHVYGRLRSRVLGVDPPGSDEPGHGCLLVLLEP